MLVLLVALTLRLAWIWTKPATLDTRLGDQFEYLELGRNLLQNHELKFFDNRFDQWAYAYRTPGYPVLIALCAAKVRVVQMVQAVADTSTVLGVFLLARRWLSDRASLVAAAITALNPFLIYFCARVLTETIFTTMLVWGMYLLTSRRWWFGVVVLILSVTVRPSAIGLVLLLSLWRNWKVALTAAGAILVTLLPWAWRNAHHPQLRAWIWTTTNGGITTYDGFHDGASGASDQNQFVERLRPQLFRLDEVERDQFLSQKAHEWIRSHPWESMRLALMKICRTWSPIPLSKEYGSRKYIAVGLLFSLPFDVLVILGLWKGSSPRKAKVLLLIPAIYFTVIHALSVGSLRYRIPAEPPMSVLVGSWACAQACLRVSNGPARRNPG
jgi:hypothetical protein